MKVHQEDLVIKTIKRIEVIDITGRVEEVVARSDVRNGICQIFLRHSTVGIMLEEAEAGLMRDIEGMIRKQFPRGAGYEHDRIDGNADSHLASGVIGQSRIVPIKEGKMVMGTCSGSFS